MLVLGIESSCDDTCAAVVDGAGVVRSDVVIGQAATHAPWGGIVPELASRDHLANAGRAVERALAGAGVGLADVDAIAVTHRPGLVGALLVGVQIAKGLAWGATKPLVGVDHLVGHLLAVFLVRDTGSSSAPAPGFPFVGLLASGGHTGIYRVDAPRADAIVELGGTRDDAAGEAFDKVAKLLRLGYPGGPVIDRLARSGDARRFPFEVPMGDTATLEMSFSGLKTRVARHVRERAARLGDDVGQDEVVDLCASFQAAVTGVLARKLVRAAEREGVVDVVIGGGVAANTELRARVQAMCDERGLRAFVPPIVSCTDNAAMIAYVGALDLERGRTSGWDLVTSSATLLPRITRKGGGRR